MVPTAGATKVIMFVGSASALFLLLSATFFLKTVVELTLNRAAIADMQAHQSSVEGALTIRVNTFRRLDLLETFLNHYDRCRAVHQIQVVWSDPETPAPTEWSKRYADGNVVFEVHDTNSLNHRFRCLLPVATEVRARGHGLCCCVVLYWVFRSCVSVHHALFRFGVVCPQPPPLHVGGVIDRRRPRGPLRRH